MKKLRIGLLLVALGLPFSEVIAETHPELTMVAHTLESVVDKLQPKTAFNYSEDSPSLFVSYRTGIFKVLPKARNGGYLPIRDEMGPDSQGFYLKIHLQNKGEVNQLGMKQTLQESLWTTDYDVTPLHGTDKQIAWFLSYRPDTDLALLEDIRHALSRWNPSLRSLISYATIPGMPEKELIPLLEGFIALIASAVEKESGLFDTKETQSSIDYGSIHAGNIFIGRSFIKNRGPRTVFSKDDPKTKNLQTMPSHQILDDTLALTLFFNRTTPFLQRTYSYSLGSLSQGLEFGFSLTTGKNHDQQAIVEKVTSISMKALREAFHRAGIRLPEDSVPPLTEWNPLPKTLNSLDFVPIELQLKQPDQNILPNIYIHKQGSTIP